MTAVLLGLLAGALFGALGVAARWALARGADPEVGALVSTGAGTLVSLVLMLATGLEIGDWGIAELWPFLVLGMAVPGASSVLFIQAVRAIGPSRAVVLIGMAPLISVVAAIIFLAERPSAPLIVGTILVVLAGLFFAGERLRPEGFRAIGIVLAISCALLFAGRDNIVRWVSTGEDVPPLVAATASLAAGTLFILLYLLIARRKRLATESKRVLLAFVPAGILLGLAYDALIAAFDHGRVSVVAPLNATQALWAVVFAALLIGASEALSRQLVIAALLVVAGSALIGAFR